MVKKNNLLETSIKSSFDNIKGENKIWRSIDDIASATGETKSHIAEVIKLSNDFVEDSNNQITTKQLYKEKTPFTVKLLHALKNKIE